MEGRVHYVKELFGKSTFGLASLGGGVAPSLFGIASHELQWWALLFGVIIGGVTASFKVHEFYVRFIKRK
jgi:hypothetical protein